ncbi:MAG: STAS-like domain-containing protein [Flavobacteriaceae bacterium]|nr:STAS-like domain-containing protein [Flavobacteriaceae bacterium]
MNFLDLNKVVENYSSNAEGYKLFTLLDKYAEENQIVVISIDNTAALSSSFLNSSIGQFLDKYGFDLFKSNIKIKTSKTQFNRLLNYLDKYNNLYTC